MSLMKRKYMTRILCKRCSEPITFSDYNYSIKYFGKALCMSCQNVERCNNKEAEKNFEMLGMLLESSK